MSVLIDSFGWIEYFGEGALVEKYARYIEKANREEYCTPSIVLYEVYKKIKREISEEKALEAYAYIVAYTSIVPLTEDLAVEAAEISLGRGLSMADAMIKATAQKYNAKIITGDEHFKGLKDVELIK
ncbi:MAG: type II toxin-antitoxin system VapC family toxin [Candidatus Hydrothermarchaeales archaeon]